VRIRILATLALFLLGGATPLRASLGPAPKWQPPASQGAESGDAKPSLTAVLPGGATPLPATPQCLPLASQGKETGDAKPSLTAKVIPNFDAEDRDYMIRTHCVRGCW
jgi:hypothetical protein